MKYKNDYKTEDKAWYEPLPNLVAKEDLHVKFFRSSPDALLPKRANETDAGWDLFAAESVSWDFSEGPKLVGTGLKMLLPAGWEAQIRPRSGMSLKGWKVCNSPGTVDSGYTGEVKIILSPPDDKQTYTINKGDKIAQMVFKRVPSVAISEISEEEFLSSSNTPRGAGGFGSTGNR